MTKCICNVLPFQQLFWTFTYFIRNLTNKYLGTFSGKIPFTNKANIIDINIQKEHFALIKSHLSFDQFHFQSWPVSCSHLMRWTLSQKAPIDKSVSGDIWKLVIWRKREEENKTLVEDVVLLAHCCAIFLCHLGIDIEIQVSTSERSSGWAIN